MSIEKEFPIVLMPKRISAVVARAFRSPLPPIIRTSTLFQSVGESRLVELFGKNWWGVKEDE